MSGPKCKTMGWYHDGSEDQAAHMDGRKPIECPDCVAYRERNES